MELTPGGQVASRQAHTLKIAGSNPASAKFQHTNMNMKRLFILSVTALLPLTGFAGSERLEAFKEIYHTATAPVNGTNEIQTLTFGATITGGTFKLGFAGKTTAAITWSSTNATLVSNIDTALEALGTIGSSGVVTAVGTITSGANGTVTVTFSGSNVARKDVPQMTVEDNSMTGAAHTLAVSTTTAGVEADGRIKPTGTIIVADDTGLIYTNTGSPPNPTWTKPSAQ